MKNISPSKPPLLVDENIPLGVISVLSRKGFDAKRIKPSSKDGQVFELAKSEERVLLTLDKHFLNKIKFPPKESSGIIFLKIHPPTIDSIIFLLKRLFNKINTPEFKGRLFIVSPFGLRIK